MTRTNCSEDTRRNIRIRYKCGPGIRAVSIDASPADCIRFAMDRFNETYDMAFSGLNNGINLGHDVGYSGTVGAAFEANYAGIKVISVSTVFGNAGNAAKAPTAIDSLPPPDFHRDNITPGRRKKWDHISVIPRFPCI